MKARALKYLLITLLALLFIVMMLPFIGRLSASYFNTLSLKQDDARQPSAACKDFSGRGSGIAYQPIHTEVNPDKQQIMFSVSMRFFAADVAEKDVTALIFFDGRQVYYGDKVVRLRCGEETTQEFIVDMNASGMPSTAHFFITELPHIPPSISRVMQTYPSGRSSSNDNIDSMHHAADSEIIRFASAMPYHSDRFADIPVTIIPHPDDTRMLMYLFDDDPEEQLETVVTLGKDRQDYDFSLRFQREKHMADIISLTCTLDNQQQDVFHGHHFWSGTLKNGDEIHLGGKVSVAEAGWHALRCFILNGLYDDTAEFSTSFAPVVYIYKAE